LPFLPPSLALPLRRGGLPFLVLEGRGREGGRGRGGSEGGEEEAVDQDVGVPTDGGRKVRVVGDVQGEMTPREGGREGGRGGGREGKWVNEVRMVGNFQGKMTPWRREGGSEGGREGGRARRKGKIRPK